MLWVVKRMDEAVDNLHYVIYVLILSVTYSFYLHYPHHMTYLGTKVAFILFDNFIQDTR